MFTHFSILFVILFSAAIWEKQIRSNKLRALNEGDMYSYKGSLMPWVLTFGYLTVLAGMRSGMNDTFLYIYSFITAPATWNAFFDSLHGDIRYLGTNAIEILFKILVSKDYHVWFLSWAFVESCLFINVLRRESVSFLDACFFFFASTLYYNYFSMMRQWMAVAIVFWGSRYLRDGKLIKYCITCLIAAVFHASALFMIPVFFIARNKVWGKSQLFVTVVFSIVVFTLKPFLSSLDSITDGTTYDYVIDTMKNGSGSSFVRVFIAAVPVVLAYMVRDGEHPMMINISINMSLLNLFLTILASMTSGLFVIRMSTFMAIYGCILFPYLLNTSWPKIKPFYYSLYLLFFIYQTSHMGAWGYKSDVLHFLSNY